MRTKHIALAVAVAAALTLAAPAAVALAPLETRSCGTTSYGYPISVRATERRLHAGPTSHGQGHRRKPAVLRGPRAASAVLARGLPLHGELLHASDPRHVERSLREGAQQTDHSEDTVNTTTKGTRSDRGGMRKSHAKLHYFEDYLHWLVGDLDKAPKTG